ncbi:MAG: DUF2283 domain-containing protein [bacterium]
MEITYDQRYNIGYIRFKEKTRGIETIQISDELNIDISPDGKVYGIELLNANEQLKIMEKKEFAFTNESTGKTVQFPISVTH